MDLKKLADEFPVEDLEWRVMKDGKNANGVWAMIVPYVTNRAIMDRLDDVCGPENWRNEAVPSRIGNVDGVLSTIYIRTGTSGMSSYADMGSYGWIGKTDGAEATDFETFKGGLSDAMKRSAVQWGIGRYLYKWDSNFAEVSTEKARPGKQWRGNKLKDGTFYWWRPPAPGELRRAKPTDKPKVSGQRSDAPHGAMPDPGHPGEPSEAIDAAVVVHIQDKLKECETPQEVEQLAHMVENDQGTDADTKGYIKSLLKHEWWKRKYQTAAF